MTRKRSKYRPRGVIHDTMSWLLAGRKPLVEIGDANTSLRIRNYSAIESVAKGRATMADIDTLIAVSNMAMALKHMDIGREYAMGLMAGADAVEALRDRGMKIGRFIATGLELQSMRLMLEIHDAQLDVSRVETIEKAIMIAQKKQAVAV